MIKAVSLPPFWHLERSKTMDKASKQKELKQIVAIANELIQKSSEELTKTEKKAVLYMASKIKPTDKEGTEYLFNAENFCQVCNFNTDGGWYANRVREIVIQLKKKVIEIPLGGKRKLITSWFNDAVIDFETNEIKITFSKYLTPYLYELQKQYTSFALENVLGMKSIYGIKLYEYLKSVYYKGTRHTITLDELRERTGCIGKYEGSSDIRKYVLEPAMKDINELTDLEVIYRLIKTGKKVSHIEFILHEPRPVDELRRTWNRERELGLRE